MAITRVTTELRQLAERQRCRLRILGRESEELAIPPIGIVVGADPSADVTLDDAAVSRRHCTIVPTEGGFDVADLGSKNGTYLDGVALTRATVPAGAILRIGTSLLQLLPQEVAVELEPSRSSSFGSMFGESTAMRQVFAVLERAATSSAPILFIGESGTGKELAARAVHDHSPRRDRPFVVFDCGASTETLIESDLFGHKKGAFTGAVSDREGAFARAHGGTLFLDEIGDLPLALQPKLLRLLEAGEFTPLGAESSSKNDVRIVAATHRNLWDEVGRGGFRGDLYYRLAVVEVHLPPLRQRLADIPELVRRFLAGHGVAASDIAGPNLERLCSYHWPGNVRELRNVIARAVALAAPGASFADMPILLRAAAAAEAAPGEAIRADRPFHQAKEELISNFERHYLQDLMRQCGGNIAQAARTAGVERKYLYKLLEKAGIDRPAR